MKKTILLIILCAFAINSYAQSESVIVNVSANVPVPSSGGGGGGGGGSSSSNTSVSFEGRAYPLSKVVVLKDGQVATETIAGPSGRFSVSIGNLSSGNYNFSVYGEDEDGRKSSLFSFPIFITSGANTEVTDIYVSPTIGLDKKQVKQGDNIAIFGKASPNSNITISVNSPVEFFKYTEADEDGVYLFNFDSSPLEMGQHSTKSKSALDNLVSSYGRVLGFSVGSENIFAGDDEIFMIGDLNNDGRVNLIDFSVAAFWYKKTLSDDMIQKDIDHLNSDAKVDLVDFSIMAFHWTG